MLTIIKPNVLKKLTKKSREISVLTHDGLFHSDEVFSIALLKLFYKEINIVRTRNSVLVEQALTDPKVFVLDVGNSFMPEMRNFDHHQEGSPEGLSSITLLYFHLFPDYQEDRMLSKVYERLIRGINEWDQGIADRNLAGHPLHLPQMISAFNRFGKPEQDSQFLKAIDFAYRILANEMNTAKETIYAEEIWKNKEQLNHEIAILKEHCLFWRIVQGEKKTFKYIIQPDAENWSIMSVDSKLFPLPQITGDTEGLIFQHKDRFIIIFNNYQAAINYANQFLIKI